MIPILDELEPLSLPEVSEEVESDEVDDSDVQIVSNQVGLAFLWSLFEV